MFKSRKKTVIFKTWATTFFEIKKKKKKSDGNVENNDQVIMPGLETGTFWVIGRHDNDYYKKFWQDKVKIFLIMLNWSIAKKWKFVNLKFTSRKTVCFGFYRKNGRVVMTIVC